MSQQRSGLIDAAMVMHDLSRFLRPLPEQIRSGSAALAVLRKKLNATKGPIDGALEVERADALLREIARAGTARMNTDDRHLAGTYAMKIFRAIDQLEPPHEDSSSVGNPANATEEVS